MPVGLRQSMVNNVSYRLQIMLSEVSAQLISAVSFTWLFLLTQQWAQSLRHWSVNLGVGGTKELGGAKEMGGITASLWFVREYCLSDVGDWPTNRPLKNPASEAPVPSVKCLWEITCFFLMILHNKAEKWMLRSKRLLMLLVLCSRCLGHQSSELHLWRHFMSQLPSAHPSFG